jgi:ADP-ribose pyrophosphatase
MKILSTQIVFTSKYFKVRRNHIERDGKEFTKEIIERNATVIILPYTENNDVYIESQFRDALGKKIFEMVGGTIEEGGDPLETAKRELLEETGLSAKNWKKLAEWNLSPNINAKIYFYAATELQEGKQQTDIDEEITVLKMPFAEVLKKIETEEIYIAAHISAFLLFDRWQKEGKL